MPDRAIELFDVFLADNRLVFIDILPQGLINISASLNAVSFHLLSYRQIIHGPQELVVLDLFSHL